jgi:hypothetical protein
MTDSALHAQHAQSDSVSSDAQVWRPVVLVPTAKRRSP